MDNNTIVKEFFELQTPSGAIIRGDMRWNHNGVVSKLLPVVIVCHGFKAFKDWGPFPAIGRYFAEQGFVSIVFNFSHNGIGEHPRKYTEHEKFSINTYTLELEDVETLLDAITEEKLPCPHMDDSKIFLVGHSRGGAIAIVKAKEDRRIKAVVSWSSISNFNRYSDEQKKRWREKGYVQLHSISNVSAFRITTALLDDIEQNQKRLNILRAVEQLHKPLLIIQGSSDIPVKVDEAKNIYEASDKNLTKFIILDGIGHMYGAKHPYREKSSTMTHVLELTSTWIHNNL